MNTMLSDALREYTGLRHQLDENLVGENGSEWAEQLKKFLRKEQCWSNGSIVADIALPTSELTTAPSVPVAKRTLTVWRRIKGGGTTLAKLLKALGSMASDWAKGMMGKPVFKVSEKTYQTDLVTLTPRELGFTKYPRTDEFMTREFCAKWSAENLDGQVIELCEPEDGPQLRCQYDDQPKGEVVWLAMERIAASDGDPGVFYVRRIDDGYRWLFGYCAYPDLEWNLDRRVVFRLRKVQPSDTLK
jgi:hypothetical protein